MLTGIRVLIVEPHAANAKLLAILLRDARADLRVVGSAEEALAVIGAFQPRLMTVDLMLPRMTGLALIRTVTHDPKTADIVVVAVSGLTGPEIDHQVRAAGAVGLIRKPVSIETYADQLSAFLGGKP